MEWDTAAGDAILRCAGGSVRLPNNKPFMYGKDNYRNDSFIAHGSF
jgi:3'(2'), 5'-bisphosphate nucleotidase